MEKTLPETTFKSKLLQILKFVLFFGLGLLIIWIFQQNLTEEDKQQIWHSLQEARWGMVMLIVFFGFLSNVFRTLRWNLLLRPLGYRPWFANTFMSILVAYFANLAIPRLGEVLRCTFLYRYEKVPVQKSLGTVVSERVVDMVCFVLLFVVSFLLEYGTLHAYVSGLFARGMENRRGLMLSLLAGIALLVVVAAGFVVYYRRNRGRLPSSHWMRKTASVFKGFGEGFLSLWKMGKPGLFLLYSAGIWFCYWMMMYFAFHSLPALSQAGGGIALIALTLGTIGIMVTPGGIGLYPVIISETMSMFGFAKVVGYTAGWIAWGTQTAVIVLAGLLAMALLPVLNAGRKPEGVAEKDRR